MTDLAVAVAVTDSAGLKTSATSTITVTTTTTTTVNIGETTILPYGDSGNGGMLLAQPITLTQQAAIQSLSFYVATIGGQLRLGLYSGATPTTLVAQTAAFIPVAGWNTQPTTTTPNISAGQYWLAYLPQSNTLAFRGSDTGGTSYYKGQAFGPMPATFPAGPSSTPTHWSHYGTFSTGPPPPQLPPGTPIGVGLSKVSVGKPPNANSIVGVVNVTTSGGAAYTGQLVLGGTDAAKFVLSNSGKLPCNLMVGPIDIPAGNYSINITAS